MFREMDATLSYPGGYKKGDERGDIDSVCFTDRMYRRNNAMASVLV